MDDTGLLPGETGESEETRNERNRTTGGFIRGEEGRGRTKRSRTPLNSAVELGEVQPLGLGRSEAGSRPPSNSPRGPS